MRFLLFVVLAVAGSGCGTSPHRGHGCRVSSAGMMREAMSRAEPPVADPNDDEPNDAP